MEEKNEKSENKKYILKIILAILLIYVVIPIILGSLLVHKLNTNTNGGNIDKSTVKKYVNLDVDEKKEKYSDIYEYEKQVNTYLNKTYNKEFNIELHSKGYKSKERWLDNTFECGHDKNIEEYVFIVNSEFPFSSYITLWKNKKTEEIEIYEVDGGKDNREDTSFKKYFELYNTKLSSETELKDILNNEYDILMYDDPESIIVILNNSPENLYAIHGEKFEDMISKLDKLKIEIDFKYNNKILDMYDINKIIGKELLKNELNNYLYEAMPGNYYIIDEENDIKIVVNKNFKKEYSANMSKYNSIFNDVYDISCKSNFKRNFIF